MKNKLFFTAFCLFVVLFGLARASAQSLRVGDSFDLRIGGVPSDDAANISSNYTVDGEGCLNLPFLGKLHVAGMNAAQIQSAVERAYVNGGIFTHPTIMLNVQANAKFVNVSGAVKSPMRVPYTPDMTVMSAINAAGDFNDYAKQTDVRLTRGNTVKKINCKDARKNPALDMAVQPGDSIQVPEAFF